MEEGITQEVVSAKEVTTLEVVVVEEGITLEVTEEEVTTLDMEEAQGSQVMARTKVEALITLACLGAILATASPAISMSKTMATSMIITIGEAKTTGKDITPAAVAITLEGQSTVQEAGATTLARDRPGTSLEEGEDSTPEVPYTVPRCLEDWRNWRGSAIYRYQVIG